MLMESVCKWIVQWLSGSGAAVVIALVREEIVHGLGFGQIAAASSKGVDSNCLLIKVQPKFGSGYALN